MNSIESSLAAPMVAFGALGALIWGIALSLGPGDAPQ